MKKFLIALALALASRLAFAQGEEARLAYCLNGSNWIPMAAAAGTAITPTPVGINLYGMNGSNSTPITCDANGNLTPSEQTVTLTPLAAAGSTATVACIAGFTCSPDFGVVLLTASGTGQASGDIFKVTWANASDHSRVCVDQAWDGTASAQTTTILMDITASLQTTTKNTWFMAAAPTASHAYTIMYVCR